MRWPESTRTPVMPQRTGTTTTAAGWHGTTSGRSPASRPASRWPSVWSSADLVMNQDFSAGHLVGTPGAARFLGSLTNGGATDQLVYEVIEAGRCMVVRW